MRTFLKVGRPTGRDIPGARRELCVCGCYPTGAVSSGRREAYPGSRARAAGTASAALHSACTVGCWGWSSAVDLQIVQSCCASTPERRSVSSVSLSFRLCTLRCSNRLATFALNLPFRLAEMCLRSYTRDSFQATDFLLLG